jgi:hypothetical protein
MVEMECGIPRQVEKQDAGWKARRYRARATSLS